MLKAGLKKNADTALAYAARGCHTPIVKALLGSGAKVTATVEGSPALSLAAAGNCSETAEFLIANGADVNGTDETGMTAMMEAAAWGYDAVVKLLLDKGGDMKRATRTASRPGPLRPPASTWRSSNCSNRSEKRATRNERG